MYEGDVSPLDAWEMLKSDPNSVLIDVRTSAEWAHSGYPVLQGLENLTLQLSWRLYPNMEFNPYFVQTISKEIPEKDRKLLFICRTGSRSKEAAIKMTQEGYKYCFNIEDGFEGALDENHQRGRVNGWKFNKLAWEQS
jgi:rhodanese-related sulfurtransferase